MRSKIKKKKENGDDFPKSWFIHVFFFLLWESERIFLSCILLKWVCGFLLYHVYFVRPSEMSVLIDVIVEQSRLKATNIRATEEWKRRRRQERILRRKNEGNGRDKNECAKPSNTLLVIAIQNKNYYSKNVWIFFPHFLLSSSSVRLLSSQAFVRQH